MRCAAVIIVTPSAFARPRACYGVSPSMRLAERRGGACGNGNDRYKAAQTVALDNIVVRIAGREIRSGATANLPAGRRIGLVGRNGAGKTTLFKVILGTLHQDDGNISWPSAWRVGAVAQE